jgi:hypothetical protein
MTHYPVNIIQDGGPIFMIPLVLLIVLILILFILAFIGKNAINKTSKLIGHISLFAMVWGFLGSTIGLIAAFDAIEGSGGVSQPIIASGLKIALITTLFGLLAFLIGRATMIVLALKDKA